MALLLHDSFCNSLGPESFKEKADHVTEINYYKNNEILFSCFYEKSRLVKKLDFEREKRYKAILNYHNNYHFKTVYTLSGEISSKHMVINDIFSENGKTSYRIESENDWEINLLENGVQELCYNNEDLHIRYWFKGDQLIKLIFDIPNYEDSYIINAMYDGLGRVIRIDKEFPKYSSIFHNEIKWFTYQDDLEIERLYKEEKLNFKLTQHDEHKRPIKMVSFIDHEDQLDNVKEYMKNPDEETLKPIMKFITLEIFEYDQFDNRTSYHKMYYRPGFSKDRLTLRLEDCDFYDKYNINFGYYYCKTKEDHDDCSESLSKLEYLEDKVNQYDNQKLIAVHHIKNEKKVKSEFLIENWYALEKYNQDRNDAFTAKDLYVIEKYDEYGNAVESSVENKTSGTIDYYHIEVLYQEKFETEN